MNFTFPSFGASTPAATPSLFPATSTAVTPAPAAAPITLDTQFSSLPDNVKSEIEKIYAHIQDQKSKSEEIEQHSWKDLMKAKGQVGALKEKLSAIRTKLENDITASNGIKRTATAELKNAEQAYRAMQRLKTPGAGASSYYNTPPPIQYFVELGEQLERRLLQYSGNIEQIDKYLSQSAEHRPYSPDMLQHVMRNQYELFMSLAGQVALLHDAVQDRKQEYLAMRRKHFKDRGDPFEESDLRTKLKIAPPPEQPNPLLALPAPAATPAPAAPSTFSSGLFGAATAPTAAASAAPSAFGTPMPSASAAPAASGAFSFFPSAAASSAAPATSLFGATPAATPASAATGFSLTPSPATTSSLFGASTPATGSLFGAATPSAGTSLFGTTLGTPAAATPGAGTLFGGLNTSTGAAGDKRLSTSGSRPAQKKKGR